MRSNAFRAAVEASDHAGMLAAVSPDVVFHSPVTFKPIVGEQAVGVLFGILLDVFEDFRYTDQLESGDVATLVFRTRVGDREVEGIDLLRFDPDGRIADFTVMARPLSALNALKDAIGERLIAAGVTAPPRGA